MCFFALSQSFTLLMGNFIFLKFNRYWTWITSIHENMWSLNFSCSCILHGSACLKCLVSICLKIKPCVYCSIAELTTDGTLMNRWTLLMRLVYTFISLIESLIETQDITENQHPNICTWLFTIMSLIWIRVLIEFK